MFSITTVSAKIFPHQQICGYITNAIRLPEFLLSFAQSLVYPTVAPSLTLVQKNHRRGGAAAPRSAHPQIPHHAFVVMGSFNGRIKPMVWRDFSSNYCCARCDRAVGKSESWLKQWATGSSCKVEMTCIQPF